MNFFSNISLFTEYIQLNILFQTIVFLIKIYHNNSEKYLKIIQILYGHLNFYNLI